MNVQPPGTEKGDKFQRLPCKPSFTRSMEIILDNHYSSNNEKSAADHLTKLQQPLLHKELLFEIIILVI